MTTISIGLKWSGNKEKMGIERERVCALVCVWESKNLQNQSTNVEVKNGELSTWFDKLEFFYFIFSIYKKIDSCLLYRSCHILLEMLYGFDLVLSMYLFLPLSLSRKSFPLSKIVGFA